jgi:DNA-binding CsgD family transcriptional regulator
LSINRGGASMNGAALRGYQTNVSRIRGFKHFHCAQKRYGLAQFGQGGPEAVNMQRVISGPHRLDGLTDKQRQVLDLLIEHKTSKEIARSLGISPHTVDQRIQFAKDKLGAHTRSEVALSYRRLLETCEQMTYEDSGIADAGGLLDGTAGPQGPLPVSSLRQRFRSRPQSGPEADFQVVPEPFDGRYGTLVRLGSIFAIALFLVLVVLGGLAMFNQLSILMAR